jgi:hypothetical protein
MEASRSAFKLEARGWQKCTVLVLKAKGQGGQQDYMCGVACLTNKLKGK